MMSMARLTLAACLVLTGLSAIVPMHAQKKDYLSQTEADRVRDSETPTDRIKLFISFAADRIKKLQYELTRGGNDTRAMERVSNLIINYTNCVDEAADLIDLGTEKQQDIRNAVKEMQTRAPEFLDYLKGLEAQGARISPFKDDLDDAIDATNDAIKSADEATKELAPPVRRRPA